MNARMRRLASDYEQVKKDFLGHKNIVVTPVGPEPAERYHVTYFLNGLYLLPDGTPQILTRHEVDIILHSDYPRYKPLCKIATPIWHPNFKNGDICIGDIWGAGETISDIIINIGDMIQYKSWNSFSPLSAEAAKWAMENKERFPVGNVDLYISEDVEKASAVEIDLFGDDADSLDSATETVEEGNLAAENAVDGVLASAVNIPAADGIPAETPVAEPAADVADASAPVEGFQSYEQPKTPDGNDFDITPEELEGIEFIPSAQRMQTVNHSTVKGGINFKTILFKGLIWAVIGAILSFVLSEFGANKITNADIADFKGYPYLAEYYEYGDLADAEFEKSYNIFLEYCEENGYDPEDEDVFGNWYVYEGSGYFDTYMEYKEKSDNALDKSYEYEFDSDEDDIISAFENVVRMSTAIWSAAIAIAIGLFLGFGEGIFYGSFKKALLFGSIGAAVSLILGYVSGYLAQILYNDLQDGEEIGDGEQMLIRGLAWAIMGAGVGLAVGVIKPGIRRILFCTLGGAIGGFVGGLVFDPINKVFPNDMISRAIGIGVLGILIGLGVGLFEQAAKQAWLKVVRGAFEGKEYLVFTGVTKIGNNGKNTIVLFKDKLVGPHHCDITMVGRSYVITDCGTPMGTLVNGQRIQRHTLRHGDVIAIGNSVLVFNSK